MTRFALFSLLVATLALSSGCGGPLESEEAQSEEVGTTTQALLTATIYCSTDSGIYCAKRGYRHYVSKGPCFYSGKNYVKTVTCY